MTAIKNRYLDFNRKMYIRINPPNSYEIAIRRIFFMGRLIHILKGILIIEKEEYSYEKY